MVFLYKYWFRHQSRPKHTQNIHVTIKRAYWIVPVVENTQRTVAYQSCVDVAISFYGASYNVQGRKHTCRRVDKVIHLVLSFYAGTNSYNQSLIWVCSHLHFSHSTRFVFTYRCIDEVKCNGFQHSLNNKAMLTVDFEQHFQ